MQVRKKTQLKVRSRVICSLGASVPFPVFPHFKTGFLSHRPCFPGEVWLQVQPSDQSLAARCWGPPEPLLEPTMVLPPANEAAAQGGWGAGEDRCGGLRGTLCPMHSQHISQGWVLELFTCFLHPFFSPDQMGTAALCPLSVWLQSCFGSNQFCPCLSQNTLH